MLRHPAHLVSCLLALGTLGIGLPAQAASQGCPFVGPLDGFQAPDEPQSIGYDTREFVDQKQKVQKTGHVCKQIYRLKPGAPKPTPLAIMSSYAKSIPAQGARVTNADRPDDDDVYAVQTKNGVETWIYVYESNRDTVTVIEVQVTPFKRTLLPPSGNDYKLLGHLPTVTARPPVVKDAEEVKVMFGDKPIKVRGSYYKVIYDLPNTKPTISNLEVQENYRAALKDLGATTVYSDTDGETVARYDNHGQVVWLEVDSGAAITVIAVEEKPVELPAPAAQANDLKTIIEREGRVTLYINFDFNKATLKPDAHAVIGQVVALMKGNPALKLSVEGYTDGIGAHDFNVKLSQERAAAVVAAIVAQSIDGSRLTSAGIGPDRPIAPNDTSEGRAKNRRVELVRK